MSGETMFTIYVCLSLLTGHALADSQTVRVNMLMTRDDIVSMSQFFGIALFAPLFWIKGIVKCIWWVIKFIGRSLNDGFERLMA